MFRAGIKRLSALAFAVLTLSLALSAAEITENPGKEFLVYGDKQSNEKIAEILEETADSLDNYCYNNGIIYLALNEQNTKQIRLYENSTAFSESVGELTSLSDDKITALAPEIAGDGFHTETVAQNGIKFIKATALSEDSGGKFTLIQYITVTSKRSIPFHFIPRRAKIPITPKRFFLPFLSERALLRRQRKSLTAIFLWHSP